MHLILYLTAAVFPALASGEMHEQGCCSPEKMQMKATYSSGIGPDNPSQIEAKASVIAFDYGIQKVAIHEMVWINSAPAINLTVIMDYNDEINYYIFDGQCKRETLKLPMKHQCISNEATYNGRMRLGSSKSGLDVDSWTLSFDLEKVAGVTTSLYEPESCLPVTDHSKLYDKETKQGQTLSLMYFDVKPSISDMSIFNVPDICKNAPFK